MNRLVFYGTAESAGFTLTRTVRGCWSVQECSLWSQVAVAVIGGVRGAHGHMLHAAPAASGPGCWHDVA
jgi:hypothetical protein